MKSIEWQTDLADTRAGLFCAYLAVGTLLGLPLLVALALLVTLPVTIPALLANPSALVLVVVLVLVGGPMSLLYLWPVLTESDQRRPIVPDPVLDVLTRRGVVAAAVAGALAHGLGLVLFALSPLIVILVGGLAASAGTWLLLTAGRIDPDGRRLEVRQSLNERESAGRTVDLDTWTALARYRLGPVTLLRPTYGPGVRGGVPRLIPLPTWVADEAAPVFEAALAAPTPEPDRAPNPVVAATLAVFGFGCLAVGVGIVLLEAAPASSRLYVLGLSAAFGGIFLVAALREY